MKSAIKMAVCQFFVVLTAIFCLLMGTSAIVGSLAPLSALAYCSLALFAADLLCRLLLPAAAPQPGPVRNAAPKPAARPACPSANVSLRVVSGGKAA